MPLGVCDISSVVLRFFAAYAYIVNRDSLFLVLNDDRASELKYDESVLTLSTRFDIARFDWQTFIVTYVSRKVRIHFINVST